MCDSKYYMIKDCPKKESNEEKAEQGTRKTEEINIILFSAIPDNNQLRLVIEDGLLDCGCTKTVSGEFWIKVYLNDLPEEDKKNFQEERSDSRFRFGDGHECKSMKRLIIPIRIGKKKYLLRVDIVKEEIPLLLSHQ